MTTLQGHRGLWMHKKSLGEYSIVSEAKLQSDDYVFPNPMGTYTRADMAELVVYRSEKNGSVWVRPKKEFLERFAPVSADG